MITVYTGPGCGQCHATKLVLNKRGIPYEEISADDARETLTEMGFGPGTTLPVVVTPRETWTGFRITKLEGLAR